MLKSALFGSLPKDVEVNCRKIVVDGPDFDISSISDFTMVISFAFSSFMSWYSIRYTVSSRTRTALTAIQPRDHYNDVIMGAMASQITSLTVIYSTVYSGADQRKHQSSASLAFVRGIHRWPANSPHKRPVTRKMFPFDDVFMIPWN